MEQLLTELNAAPVIYYLVFVGGVVGLSAYVKIATVLGFLRAGFGFNSIPSAFITGALALSLSLIVMEPVIESVFESDSQKERVDTWKSFLLTNAEQQDIDRFREFSSDDNSFGVASSAFMVTQLRQAFSTGLMIFLPFLLVELLTALFCTAVGFSMYSAQFLSLPIKVLVFVGLDGWGLVTQNLLTSYVP